MTGSGNAPKWTFLPQHSAQGHLVGLLGEQYATPQSTSDLVEEPRKEENERAVLCVAAWMMKEKMTIYSNLDASLVLITIGAPIGPPRVRNASPRARLIFSPGFAVGLQ